MIGGTAAAGIAAAVAGAIGWVTGRRQRHLALVGDDLALRERAFEMLRSADVMLHEARRDLDICTRQNIDLRQDVASLRAEVAVLRLDLNVMKNGPARGREV